jgi:hypothetical protein
MADKSNQLLLDALNRAMAEPGGLPLFGGRKTAGLFTASALARKAAQFCKDEGLVRSLRTETRGRTTQEICAITEKGLAFLLDQASPKQALASLVHALEARGAQLSDLTDSVHRTQTAIETLKEVAAKVLQQLHERPAPALPCDKTMSNGNGADAAAKVVLDALTRWQTSGALEDCPLPQLYRSVCGSLPGLTVGQFHDALRRLQQSLQLYLHPWTGPMYELPEPTFALMVGHEIAYYASLRLSP